MASRQVLVKCPQCDTVKQISALSGGWWCDCHLYCAEGSKPSDCSITSARWTGQLGWPAGAHQNAADEGDNLRRRTYYCSTHELYSYKLPQFIEVDMDFFNHRLPKSMRRYTVLPKR
jgi:hypothetical protein